MFVPWDPASEDVPQLKNRIGERIEKYRKDYSAYYQSFAQPDSPPLRDTNPTVVVIPALGIFGFAKDKREARITTEFFTNAIHVMAGANALDETLPAEEVTLASGQKSKAVQRILELQQLRRAAKVRSLSD